MSKYPRVFSEKIVHQNPYMNILCQRLHYSDGRERDYFVLDRKNDFSIVIPLFDDMTTVLVGQYRVPIRQFSWEYTMGTVDGKSPLDVAKQELREETGYRAGRFIKVGEFFVAPGYAKQKANVYIAKQLTSGEPSPEPFEDLTTKVVPLANVTEMIHNGTIKDGPTITAHTFVLAYLETL